MSWIIDNLEKFNDKVVIIHKDISYTYKQLFDNIQSIKSNVIKDKINQGEVVSILDDYSFNSISLLLALYQNKNIVVPITTKIANEVADRIEESFSSKSIIIKDDIFEVSNQSIKNSHRMIKSLQDTNSSGLILFSSGSTGKPKAMIHNFDNLVNHYQGKKEKNINMLLFLLLELEAVRLDVFYITVSKKISLFYQL